MAPGRRSGSRGVRCVVMPLGALPSPREIPTHASTPCTIALRYLHRQAPEASLTPITKDARWP
jgi:hypothetical protein